MTGAQPLENVTPLLLQPKLVQGQPLHSQVLNKVSRPSLSGTPPLPALAWCLPRVQGL